MADNITSYGIIAVKFTNNVTGDKKHHHYISHVFMIPETDSAYIADGKLYSKDDAIRILTVNKTPIHTLTWNYTKGIWDHGSMVDTEEVDGIVYLRSVKNKVVTDNLKNLIDYKYFK